MNAATPFDLHLDCLLYVAADRARREGGPMAILCGPVSWTVGPAEGPDPEGFERIAEVGPGDSTREAQVGIAKRVYAAYHSGRPVSATVLAFLGKEPRPRPPKSPGDDLPAALASKAMADRLFPPAAADAPRADPPTAADPPPLAPGHKWVVERSNFGGPWKPHTVARRAGLFGLGPWRDYTLEEVVREVEEGNARDSSSSGARFRVGQARRDNYHFHDREDTLKAICGCGPGARGKCPLSIACPTCGKGPGVKCKRPSGHPCEMHAERYRAAERADALECPRFEPIETPNGTGCLNCSGTPEDHPGVAPAPTPVAPAMACDAMADPRFAVISEETRDKGGTIRRHLANGWFVDEVEDPARRRNGWLFSAWEPGGAPDGFAGFLVGGETFAETIARLPGFVALRAGGDTLAETIAQLPAAAAAPGVPRESPGTPRDAAAMPGPGDASPPSAVDLGGGWTLGKRGLDSPGDLVTGEGLAAAAAEVRAEAEATATRRGRGGRKAPAKGQGSLFD
jgi:hypothetical protein